jgi:hypothetical protein
MRPKACRSPMSTLAYQVGADCVGLAQVFARPALSSETTCPTPRAGTRPARRDASDAQRRARHRHQRASLPLRYAPAYRIRHLLPVGGHVHHFCGDFLRHFNLEVALGHEFLQARVLLLELLQPANVVGLERPEPLLPRVHRLAATLVPLRDRRNPVTIRFPEHRDHLLFREPRLAHAPSLPGSQSLT